MKTTNYILSAVSLIAITFASCENFFDEKQLDNGNYRPSDVRTSMTYTLTGDDVAIISKQCTYKGNDTVPSVADQREARDTPGDRDAEPRKPGGR